MKKKLKTFLIIIFSLLFFIGLFCCKDVIYKKFLYNYIKIQLTESLKKNFADSSNICKNKNFKAALEYEFCTWENVKNKSLDDYKSLEKIRYYCLKTTDNEYSRRICIENIVNFK